ncbi:uncharacterized protein LOC101845427 [Aplysia californica]|uniref:Uncharacterized protein LOC101845427 n=1 Tax=Aplysia californica TaxID=6500 RepID=A0ABM0K427_APLCA|nr:uncharacterized protein LOC101845427 [Aplysia californica]
MATGHILPGYGDPVSKLRRARSAGCYPLDNSSLLDLQNAARLTEREFEQIRQNARNIWLKTSPRSTTYDTFYSGGEVREITNPRPTSSHRHNNPHPPQVFLTNRLHYIEGYHNPDTTVGKSMYKIDASLSKSEQERRRAPRLKYIARPDSALVNQYKDPFGFRNHLPPRQAQAAEAWVKLADDADRERILDVVKEQGEGNQPQEEDAENRPKSAYPSLHRWMKFSGAEEYDSTSRIVQTLQSDPLRQNGFTGSLPHYSLGHKAREDIRSAGMYRFKPRLRRGEYSMHPDWPTSLPHHKVP